MMHFIIYFLPKHIKLWFNQRKLLSQHFLNSSLAFLLKHSAITEAECLEITGGQNPDNAFSMWKGVSLTK